MKEYGWELVNVLSKSLETTDENIAQQFSDCLLELIKVIYLLLLFGNNGKSGVPQEKGYSQNV